MCPDHELISAYLDGELPLPEQRSIKAHVEDCLVCQVIYRNLTTVSEAFSRLIVPAVSDNFMTQLLNQLPTPAGHPTQTTLSAYYDHALSEDEYPQIAEHVASCDQCAHMIQRLQHLSQGLQALPTPAATADFMEHLFAQLEPQHPDFETLSAYYDQALDVALTAEVTTHVGICQSCEHHLKQLAQVQHSMQNLSVPDVSVNFMQQLCEKLETPVVIHPDALTLSAYHDDELAPAELKSVAMHLATCTPCQLQLAQLQQISAQVATLPSPASSDDFMSKLMAQVDAVQHPDIEILSAYHDAVLAIEERPAVKSHVAQCHSCQHQLAGFRQLNTTLQALPQPTISADFISRLDSALPTPTVAPNAKILYFRAALRSRYSRMAAGIAAFGLLAVWASQYLGPQTHGIANQELTKQILPVQYRSEDELFVSDVDTFSLDSLENPIQDDYNKLLGGQS